MTQGKVISIHRVASDGGPAVPLESANVIADWGIDGDYRSGHDSDRQLTLIADDTLDQISETIGRPVPDGSSRRQIVIGHCDLQSAIGKSLFLGSVTVRVESDCPPCVRMNQTIGPGALDAMIDRNGVCARVITGGTVTVGDPVAIVTER